MADALSDLERAYDFHRAGQLAEAAEIYRQILVVEPEHFDALVNLAGALAMAGQWDQAAVHLEQALGVDPRSAEVHLHLGDIRSRRGDWAPALAHYQEALAIEPANAAAELRWGMVLQAKRQFDEAVTHYRRAVALAPRDIENQMALAKGLALMGQNVEALDGYEGILAVEPTHGRALANLTAICLEGGAFARGIANQDRALEHAPGDPLTHFNRALLLLTSGDLRAGWKEFEWRTHVMKGPPRAFAGPTWDGSANSGATLLIYGEQGIGDVLQFVRYVPLVRARGLRPLVVVQDRLVPLLKESGFDDVFAFSDSLPPYDCKISQLDLPRVFDTTLETIPADVPYLRASPSLVRHWGQRLAEFEGFRVGICWQGSSGNQIDSVRSVPLAAFEPLATVRGVRLVSLQKQAGLDQLDSVAGRFPLVNFGAELDEASGPLMDTAALMQHLDLVVTVDSAIAHLAGGLGVRTWLALAARADWRWLHGREDSPWYPSVRLFRQAKLHDWAELFNRIAAELRVLIESKPQKRRDDTT